MVDEKVSSMGLKTWFHPTIDVQRADDSDLYAFDAKQGYYSTWRFSSL